MITRKLSRTGRTLAIAITAMLLLGTMAGTALASSVTPSSNDANRDLGWAHVNVVDIGIGEITLEFVSTRGFFSCFEYRTDGDESQKIGDDNWNPAIDDGLYPSICRKNNSIEMVFEADEYIEVRMVFGAEEDERFDWTRFDVLPDVQSADDCKDGGWEAFGFSNQGQCIRFVNTGQDSR